MIKKSMQISCPHGLEPRPIAELVQVASKYESKIYLEVETRRVNAKSIMGMMSLQPHNGDFLTITAEGTDQEAAIAEIEDVLRNKLNLIS